MKKVTVKLNKKEVRKQLLKSDWIMDKCAEVARGIAERSGGQLDQYTGKNRINVSVSADADTDNTLLKALR